MVVVMVVGMAEAVFRALVLEVTVHQAALPLSSPDSGDLGKSVPVHCGPPTESARCSDRHSVSFPQWPGSRPGSGGDRIGLLSVKESGPGQDSPHQAGTRHRQTLSARCPRSRWSGGGRGGAGAGRQGGGAAARTPTRPAAPAGRCPALAAEGGSAVLIPPLAAVVPSCWRRRRESGRRAAARAQRPPRRPAGSGTHVESGVLGAEEREGHGERPQPRAAVVLLGGDSVAVLRAERVEVGQGHRAAHPARPEPQGHSHEQRPGGTARHRQWSAAGTGRDKAAQSWDG